MSWGRAFLAWTDWAAKTFLPVHSLLLLALIHVDPLAAQSTPLSTITDEPDAEKEQDQLYQRITTDVEFLERKGNLLKNVVKLVRPSVVHIAAEKSSRPERLDHRTIEEAGSGFIVHLDSNYYVLTNRHVIRYSPLSKIMLRLADGVKLKPIQLWSDPGTDIAVIEVSDSGLVSSRLGDSNQVEIGDFVLAVGSPFGLSHSVTFGIISAKGRRDLELGEEGVRFQDFLQTDAAINPGNSGGPLLNLRGEVIGINTAIASSSGGSEGIGFAIPIDMAMVIARQLIETGRVSRAYMGVHLDSQFTPEKARALGLARHFGAHVSGITPNSPAAAADLRVNDVILEFDGARVEDDNHLINRVSLTAVGKKVNLLVLRNGDKLNMELQVGDRSKFEQDEF
jgi:serine protease Do